MADALGSYYPIYQAIKKKNKIKTFVIYDINFRKTKNILDITHGTMRFYPLTYFPTDTWIYNDKVLIVNYTADPPVAILITSKQTAESYKKLFDSFWKKAKP